MSPIRLRFFVGLFSLLSSINQVYGANPPAKTKCEIALDFPKAFQAAFADYRDTRFLQRVFHIQVATRSLGVGRNNYLITLDMVNDAQEFIDETKISGDIEHDLIHGSASVTDLTLSPQISVEYGYKLLFAELLIRFPEIQSIRFPITAYNPLDFSILREELAKGSRTNRAFAKLPIFKALSSLGFEKIDPQSRVTEPSPDDYTPSAFEAILVMRRP